MRKVRGREKTYATRDGLSTVVLMKLCLLIILCVFGVAFPWHWQNIITIYIAPFQRVAHRALRKLYID